MMSLKAVTGLSILVVSLSIKACGTDNKAMEPAQATREESTTAEETVTNDIGEKRIEEDTSQAQEDKESETPEISVPIKEEVLAMRETVLEGMSEDEIARLTENIKVANLRMESAYLNDNIFGKLADKNSEYWQYFDQEGDIEFYGNNDEPEVVYNRFDGENFVNLISDMMGSVQNEKLQADLQQLIDLTELATRTHEVEYANEIYKILHDMDYFLLRYGMEDVGKYTRDVGVVAKYYGVLTVYKDTSFEGMEDAVYQSLIREMLETGVFPETDGAMYDGMPYENHYAIMDIDGDGKEELLLDFGNASCMAGMVLYVYDYDRETEKVYIEYGGWPDITVYDNGYLKVEASHNHGRSSLEDFWPYYLFQYNAQTDKYENVANIDAWQYQKSEDSEPDAEFPKDKDLDGDGVVYYDNTQYDKPAMIMDKAEYETWCGQYNQGNEKKITWYPIISEERYDELFPSQAVG